MRVTGDRLDVLEWKDDGTWRAVGALPSLSSLLGDWVFDGYHEIAISDAGRLAFPVARGPAGAQETRLAIVDLTRPGEPPILLGGIGAPAFLSDGTLVGLGIDRDNAVLRYAPPYTGAALAMVLPADVVDVGPTGNVTTLLSLLPGDAGLFGLRAGTLTRAATPARRESRWRSAGTARFRRRIRPSSRCRSRARTGSSIGSARTAFEQDPHAAATPAFVAQAPGRPPVVVGSTAVNTNRLAARRTPTRPSSTTGS